MPWLLGPLLAVLGSVRSEPAGRSVSPSSHSYRFVSPPVFPSWSQTIPAASRRIAEGDSSELSAFYYPIKPSEPPGETQVISINPLNNCSESVRTFTFPLQSRTSSTRGSNCGRSMSRARRWKVAHSFPSKITILRRERRRPSLPATPLRDRL